MKNFLFALLFLFVVSPNCLAQNKAVTSAGDILQFAIPAAALTATLFCKEDQAKPTWQFIKTYGSSIIAAHVIKRVVLKPRPSDGPIHDNYSFPSGHTTSAFAGAAFIQRKYGWSYGLPCYAMASFVGYSRVQGKFHDTWDVLGGATIGIASAYIFAKPYRESKVGLLFDKEKNTYTFGLTYAY
ncbi:MAG: phosphatase PAP2 family protein [Flavobacterium sp.]|nr:phosphatase PAP2 family protein [Flavobacterium sp.]